MSQRYVWSKWNRQLVYTYHAEEETRGDDWYPSTITVCRSISRNDSNGTFTTTGERTLDMDSSEATSYRADFLKTGAGWQENGWSVQYSGWPPPYEGAPTYHIWFLGYGTYHYYTQEYSKGSTSYGEGGHL